MVRFFLHCVRGVAWEGSFMYRCGMNGGMVVVGESRVGGGNDPVLCVLGVFLVL